MIKKIIVSLGFLFVSLAAFEKESFPGAVRQFFTDPGKRFFGDTSPGGFDEWPSEVLKRQTSCEQTSMSISFSDWLASVKPVLDTLQSPDEIDVDEAIKTIPFEVDVDEIVTRPCGIKNIRVINGSRTREGDRELSAMKRFIPFLKLRRSGCGFHAVVNALAMYAIFTEDYSMAAKMKDFVLNGVVPREQWYPGAILEQSDRYRNLELKLHADQEMSQEELQFMLYYQKVKNKQYPLAFMKESDMKTLIRACVRDAEPLYRIITYTVDYAQKDPNEERKRAVEKIASFFKEECSADEVVGKSSTSRFVIIGLRVHNKPGLHNSINFHYESVAMRKDHLTDTTTLVFLNNNYSKTDKNFNIIYQIARALEK